MPTSIAAKQRDVPRSTRFARLLAAALVASAFAITAAGATEPLFQGTHLDVVWGLEVSGGWNSYDMGTFNDSLRSLDRTAGTTLGTLGEGGDFGTAARAWGHPRVLLRGYLEKHTASVSSAGTRYDIAPWNAGIGATYFFTAAGPTRLGAGLSVGITSIRGKFEGPRFSLHSRGSGPDVRATGEAMWSLGSD